MSPNARIAFLLIAAVIAVGAVALFGGDEEAEVAQEPAATGEPSPEADGGVLEGPTPEPPPEEPVPQPLETIRVNEAAEPVGGVAELEATSGERVRFSVRSEVTDHVHVHGYDIMRDVAPGQPARFSFPADIEGVFEIELEDRAIPIAELTVSPG